MENLIIRKGNENESVKKETENSRVQISAEDDARYLELAKDPEANRAELQRMVEEAENLGADAIVAVRYVSSSVMQSAAEVMAYGTAVKFK